MMPALKKFESIYMSALLGDFFSSVEEFVCAMQNMVNLVSKWLVIVYN